MFPECFSKYICNKRLFSLIAESDIKLILGAEEALLATTLWYSEAAEAHDETEKEELNASQIKAINLACSNQFCLIQGPPGWFAITNFQFVLTYDRTEVFIKILEFPESCTLNSLC